MIRVILALMGSCGSVDRKSEANTKFRRSFWSKIDKHVTPASPIKDKPVSGAVRIADVALKSRWSPSPSTSNLTGHDSKEEAFFDSRPWLDLDCEDDFYSVNGDFTPSRGNTPIHQFSSSGTPNLGRKSTEKTISNSVNSVEELSPAKKKKLLELFRDSVKDDQVFSTQKLANHVIDQNSQMHDLPKKSANGTPYKSGTNSVCSSERTVNGDSTTAIREKSLKSVQCCLPAGLVSCSSFSERRKKANPVIALNGTV